MYTAYTPRTLVHLLERNGLSPEKAEIFIRRVTFGRDAEDVFDAPLLRCEHGNLLLVGAAVVGTNLTLGVGPK